MNRVKLLGVLWIAACMVLGACSSTSQERETSLSRAFGNLQGQVGDYQKQLASASGADRFALQILLARAQLMSGNNQGALTNIKALQQEADTPLLKAGVSLLEAMYLQKNGKLAEAEQRLRGIETVKLPTQAELYYHQLRAAVSEKKYQSTHNVADLLDAYQQQKLLLGLVQGHDRSATLRQCTNLLSGLEPQDLSLQLSSSRDNLDRGFFEYALISKSQSGALKDSLLSDLRNKYPNHPILEMVGTQAPALKQAATQVRQTGAQNVVELREGDKVAVLLPLTGRFANAVGDPARQGILAALQDRNAQLNVIFYDTNKVNISAIVSQIQSDDTRLIIGPILKPEVNALNNARLQIPSIVLNQPESVAPGQWYFDLGPDYEGALAAVKILQDGHRSPVVISGQDKGSLRAVDSFRRTLSAQGLQPQVCSFASPEQLSAALTSCPLSGADAVYIRASSKDAAALKALIPSPKAVYLTDMSYDGYNNSSLELSLQGAILGDMPWLLSDSPLKQSFMQYLPKANAQAQRIFAAAYDSINLAFSMPLLRANPEDVLHGLSGDLSLGQNGLIECSPLWITLGERR